MQSNMSITCERCGYPACNLNKLLKHLKEEIQCRPIKSKISHAELINKYRPPPSVESLTCTNCNRIFKSISGVKVHTKTCRMKPDAQPQLTANDQEQSTTTTSVSAKDEVHNGAKRLTYIHKNMTCHKDLHAFTKDIDWEHVDISPETYLECCVTTSQGIVDLFATVHNIPEHANIKWHQGKLIIFDGKGWTEAVNTEQLFSKHLGYIYSLLEEK